MSNFSVQQPNLDLVNWLSAYFTRRNEPNFSLAKTISTYLALPGLRGFWPMSAFGDTGQAFDQSGNVRTLTYNGNPVYNYDNLAPYIDFDGTGDYLSRADEAGLDITGTEAFAGDNGLTLGGWFRFTNAAGTAEYMMSKWGNAGFRSYRLIRDAGGTISLSVSVDGTAVTTVTSTDTPAQNTWFFTFGRFDPSAEMKIWVNDATDINTTSIPASIFNSSSPFQISGLNGASSLLTGRASLSALCAIRNSDAIILNLFQQSRGLFGV